MRGTSFVGNLRYAALTGIGGADLRQTTGSWPEYRYRSLKSVCR